MMLRLAVAAMLSAGAITVMKSDTLEITARLEPSLDPPTATTSG